MKSIKQQYIDLTEGKMSQSNFMRNLRMTMPQYVTNVTSFNDAVKILRNKGILTEGKTKLTADQVNNDELRMGIKVEMEHTDDPEKAKKIALDHLAENPFYYTQLKLSGVDTKATPSKEKQAIEKKKDETEFVDKANQMKLVKDVEKVKASANKAKKETNKTVKGVSSMSLVAKTVRGVKKMDATGEKMKKIKEGYDLSEESNDYLNPYKAAKLIADEYGDQLLKLQGKTKEDAALDFVAEKIKAVAGDTVATNLVNGISDQDWPSDYISELNALLRASIPQRVFAKNAGISKGLRRIAGLEEEKLREAIRKMIKQETFDGRDNLTDVTGENY